MIRKLLAGLFSVVLAVCCICLVACSGNSNESEGGSEWGNEYTIEAAYEKATELGYAGTLEEFIAMISGADGKDGIDGADGKDGVDGNDGADGADGIDGIDGVGIKSITVNADGELVIINTNDEIIFQDKLPVCTHSYSAWETGIEANCRTNGYEYRTCSKCGYTDYKILEVIDHEWDNGTVVFEAECTKNGLLYYTCESCGETRTEIIPATGEHVFVNGTCKYCNAGRAEILDDYYNGDYGYNYLATMNNGANLQAFYDQIDYEVIKFHNDATLTADEIEINYAECGISDDEAAAVWKTYLDDKPLYYWISKSATVSGENFVMGVESEYTDGKTRVAYNEKLYGIIDEFAAAADDESAYSLAFAYHDLIIDKINYAYNGSVPETAAWAHSIVGVFEGKGAVCEGYARAFSLLLNMRGVENIFVTGVASREEHAWNLVKLDDGNWYWYDLTFDDTPNYYWGISHTYFCATDEEFLSSHTVGSSEVLGTSFLYGLPARATEQYSGNEVMLDDIFTVSQTEYLVVGYNSVNVQYLTSGGNCVIPESVKYANRDFTVVSIMRYINNYDYSVLYNEIKFISVSIPSTVRFINQNALRPYSKNDLEEIIVDNDNQVYTSVDGVLFTKSLYTLITYPNGKTNTEYTVPDETGIIAYHAFECKNLELIRIGKGVSTAGFTNWWGCGYPDSDGKSGNIIHIITDEWNRICTYMAEGGIIEVDSENEYFTIKDGMLFNKSLTYLYAVFMSTENAVIPQTVTRMDSSAFYNCRNLKRIELPAGLTNLSEFTYCVSLEEIEIPEGITKIEEFAFFGCTSLKRVVLPSSITRIERLAFYNCKSLSEINIPASVSYIALEAFTGCPAVLTVADGNEYFVTRDGCLIELATKTIIRASDNATIPDDGSVEVIGDYAFYGCREIETIVVPEQIKTIGDSAFAYCTSLKKLVIGNGVTSIGTHWLMSVYNLEIFVEFDEEQWKEMDSDFPDAQRYRRTYYFYSEEQPEAEGNFWHYVDGEIAVW